MIWPVAERWRAPVGDFPPRWGTAWGDDAFGLWADLAVGAATQRLRWIEPSGPGGFLMGSPREERAALSTQEIRRWARRTECEPRRVVVPEGFWLGECPCTQALWEAVMGNNPSQFKGEDAPQRPVEQVSFDDVWRFLQRLRRWLPQGSEPVLPTEVQWEYAARAGTATAYPWGDEPDDTRGNWGDYCDGTTPVSRFEPNPWGLVDMHGNVSEWCADPWRMNIDEPVPSYAGRPARVVRGGSWSDGPSHARSAYRYVWHSDHRAWGLGFRFGLRAPSSGSAR